MSADMIWREENPVYCPSVFKWEADRPIVRCLRWDDRRELCQASVFRSADSECLDILRIDGETISRRSALLASLLRCSSRSCFNTDNVFCRQPKITLMLSCYYSSEDMMEYIVFVVVIVARLLLLITCSSIYRSVEVRRAQCSVFLEFGITFIAKHW